MNQPEITQYPIVTLLGSLRFPEAFRFANLHETLAGNIVLVPGCPDKQYCDSHSEAEGVMLDRIHRAKIAISSRVIVLNVDNYIGEATIGEIEYAYSLGKRVEFQEDPRNNHSDLSRVRTPLALPPGVLPPHKPTYTYAEFVEQDLTNRTTFSSSHERDK
jgi:hypothetical protein